MHIITYALALDRESDERLAIEYPENLTLKVLHLESYYNYRTVGKNFDLMTSILSNNNFCKIIEVKTQGKKTAAYVLADEIKCSKNEVHYAHIHSKKKRVFAALAQIKDTHKDKIIQTDFINHIKLGLELEGEENITSVRVKPTNCRDELDKTKNKPSCVDCDVICAYTMEDLLDTQHGIGLEDLDLSINYSYFIELIHKKCLKTFNNKKNFYKFSIHSLISYTVYLQ